MTQPGIKKLPAPALVPADAEPCLLFHVAGLPPPFRDLQGTTHPVGWRMGPGHRHDFWQLVFNQSGIGEMQADNLHRIDPARTVVIPPGISHTWANIGATPLNLFNIHILPRQPGYADLEKWLNALCSGQGSAAICPGHPDCISLMERVSTGLDGGAPGYKYQAAALLMEFVITVLRAGLDIARNLDPELHPVSRIEKAFWYMEANYGRPVGLSDIGRLMNLSPKHACEIFKRETGLPPLRHLRQLRIQKAKLLLEETTLRVKEVAFKVGFRDEHYFCRLFRKLSGISPAAYRARCLGRNRPAPNSVHHKPT